MSVNRMWPCAPNRITAQQPTKVQPLQARLASSSPRLQAIMASRAASTGRALEPLPGWWYRLYSVPEHTQINTYRVPAKRGGGVAGKLRRR